MGSCRPTSNPAQQALRRLSCHYSSWVIFVRTQTNAAVLEEKQPHQERSISKIMQLATIAILAVSLGVAAGKGAGRHIGHKLRTPYTENWKNNQTAEWYASKKGAKITKASHFDYEYVLGHKIVFLCVAKGKPRPNIVWYKDGRELYGHRY